MNYELMRQRLIGAREYIGYNRKQFAEETGIPYRTITNYENGAREPGSDYITKVADFCGVTTDYLLGLTDDPRNDATVATQRENPQINRLLDACLMLNSPAIEKVIAYACDLAWNPVNKNGFKVFPLEQGNKNTAAARSGDRVDAVSVSKDDEDAVLPPSFAGDV